jgi:hypothetical protein
MKKIANTLWREHPSVSPLDRGRLGSSMFADIDLRRLAEMTAPERAFLSVYLAGPRSAGELEKRFQKMRRVFKSLDRGQASDNRFSPKWGQFFLSIHLFLPLVTGEIACVL